MELESLGDRRSQRRRIALDEHGGGVDAGHPAQPGDRIDDHIEVIAPVLLGGEQNLGAPRTVDEHTAVAAVLGHDIAAAVHQSQVGRRDDLVRPGMVGGQIGHVILAESGFP